MFKKKERKKERKKKIGNKKKLKLFMYMTCFVTLRTSFGGTTTATGIYIHSCKYDK